MNSQIEQSIRVSVSLNRGFDTVCVQCGVIRANVNTSALEYFTGYEGRNMIVLFIPVSELYRGDSAPRMLLFLFHSLSIVRYRDSLDFDRVPRRRRRRWRRSYRPLMRRAIVLLMSQRIIPSHLCPVALPLLVRSNFFGGGGHSFPRNFRKLVSETNLKLTAPRRIRCISNQRKLEIKTFGNPSTARKPTWPTTLRSFST